MLLDAIDWSMEPRCSRYLASPVRIDDGSRVAAWGVIPQKEIDFDGEKAVNIVERLEENHHHTLCTFALPHSNYPNHV